MYHIVHFVQTRIQSSHSKVDAVTTNMRAFSDSMTVMAYRKEELKTDIVTRTYGLQGSAEEKHLKAHGIEVHIHVLCHVFN